MNIYRFRNYALEILQLSLLPKEFLGERLNQQLQTLQMRNAHVPCLVSAVIALYSITHSWSNWIFRYRLMG